MSSSTAKPKRRRSASPPSSGSRKRSSAPASSAKSASKSINNKEWRQRMKQQRHDYNTHQFLDASATVNAGLFAARRLPEIKSLWRQMVQEGLSAAEESSGRTDGKHMPIRRAGESGGGKISSRHLRRRTNSHIPRRRHRYPRGKDDACLLADGGDEERDNRVDGNSTAEIDSNVPGEKQKRKGRRARRKPALLKQSHSTWWQPRTNALMQLASSEMHGTADAELSHHWIPTHLWHAKRFHVSPPFFGWSVPLLHANRGSRASLRITSSETNQKCTLQDATWEINGCAIKIQVKKVNGADPSTQQPLHTLISVLKRLCGSDAPFLNDESILTGQRAGEGLLHEIDACPLRPIGPATFFFGPSDIGDSCEDVHVSMLVHPAIHQRVISILGGVLQPGSDVDKELTLSTTPLALLRGRGRASASTICNFFRKEEGLQAQLRDARHGTLVGLELPPSSRAELPNSGPAPKSTGISLRSPILLKCHQPNQNYQHLPHNVACSGWDILCHPSIGSSLFQELAVQGGACAIGLVEDARAQLEAYPPLPFFPRDYPDTEEGRLYWEGSASAATETEDNDTHEKEQSTSDWRDWVVIRTCIEGPWGRINTPLKRTLRQWRQQHDAQAKEVSKAPSPPKLVSRDQTSVPVIRWESLISPDNDTTIVVRGSFGIPFMQLFHGCGRLAQPSPTQESDNIGRRRRPRRRVRPPNSIVHASPLSRTESEAHSSLCQQLKGSLSLPALLRCELYCEGKGTLDTGDIIFPIVSHDGEENSIETESSGSTGGDGEKKQALPLGVVSAGGFSPARGKCHGIGFVGASKLISALDGAHAMGMAMPDSTGRKMVLKVKVARDGDSARRHALLSIIL